MVGNSPPARSPDLPSRASDWSNLPYLTSSRPVDITPQNARRHRRQRPGLDAGNMAEMRMARHLLFSGPCTRGTKKARRDISLLKPEISPPRPPRAPVCVRNAQAGKESPTLIISEEPPGRNLPEPLFRSFRFSALKTGSSFACFASSPETCPQVGGAWVANASPRVSDFNERRRRRKGSAVELQRLG